MKYLKKKKHLHGCMAQTKYKEKYLAKNNNNLPVLIICII